MTTRAVIIGVLLFVSGCTCMPAPEVDGGAGGGGEATGGGDATGGDGGATGGGGGTTGGGGGSLGGGGGTTGGGGGGSGIITAPTVSTLQQYVAGAPLSSGQTTMETPQFRAVIVDADNDNVSLEVEVVLSGASFTGTATASSSFAAPGIHLVTHPTLAPGSYKWRVRAVDVRGQSSAWADFAADPAFTLQASSVSGTLRINGGQLSTNTTAVSLNITGTSSTGTVTMMRIGNDGVLGAPEAFATSKQWTLAGADGVKSVSVQLIDSAGATFTVTDSIVLDRQGPTGAFLINGQRTYTNSTMINLDLAYTDPTGLTQATVRVQVDSNAFSPAVPYAASITAMLPAVDGLHTVKVIVDDAAGNASMVQSQTITLDRAAPDLTAPVLLRGGVATNLREPPLTSSLSDDFGLDSACALASAGNTSATMPMAIDPCWQQVRGKTAFITLAPTLPSTEGAYRVTFFVRDLAGNITSNWLEVVYDATPPTGGAPYASQHDAGYRHVSMKFDVLTSPTDGTGAGIAGYQVGISTNNVATGTAGLFTWGPTIPGVPTAGVQGTVTALAPNGRTVSAAMRYVDRAGNGGPVGNVHIDLFPRAVFEPMYVKPSASKIVSAARMPTATAQRFLLQAEDGYVFLSDDDTATWSRVDPMDDGAPQGLATSPEGLVLSLTATLVPSPLTTLMVSGDQGSTFRRAGTFDGLLQSPTWVSTRSGVTRFAALDGAGRSYRLTFDGNGELVELNSADNVGDRLAGCQGATYGGVVSLNSDVNTVAISRDDGSSYTPLTGLPFPSGYQPIGVSAAGGQVVILASGPQNGSVLIRSENCVDGPWNVLTLSTPLPAGFRVENLSVPGLWVWLLSRNTLTNEMLISKVVPGTGNMAMAEHQPTPVTDARVRVLQGGAGPTVIAAGDRGTLFAGFPTVVARRTGTSDRLASISVREGTAASAARASSVFAIGGDNSVLAYSTNSGSTWVNNQAPQPGLNIWAVDATNGAFGGLGAITSSQLFLNPQTGWVQSTPTPLPQFFNAITCTGPYCLAVGTEGAIAIISSSGGTVSSSYSVAATPGDTAIWRDIDHVYTSQGPLYTAVGSNNGLMASRVRQWGSSTFGPINTVTGVNTVLTGIALKRDGQGEAIAISRSTLWLSSSYGNIFNTSVPVPGSALNDIVQLAGTNVWVAVGNNGLVLRIVRTGPASITVTPVPIGTHADLTSVAASDGNSDVVAIVASDGSAYLSVVGARP